MSNNWKEPEPMVEPDAAYKTPPYVKSARELRVDELCNAVRNATSDQLPEAQRQLVSCLEN